MTNQVRAIIGAAYGDEGKGLMTDFFAHQALARGHSTIVSRFNGGAQAGHTVTLPNGQRHVFHHWGAGALAGATTHLAERFVVHPMLWAEETLALSQRWACLDVLVDPRARITIPFDIMLNQAAEAARGAGRHGSCGVGFGETWQRSDTPGMSLTVESARAMSDAALLGFLKHVEQSYLPERLAGLGLASSALERWANQPGIAQAFVRDLRLFLSHVTLAMPTALQAFDSVVLEGAQGLALDEDLGDFPYVTRSKTGLPYLVAVAEEAGLPAVEAYYLTRAYTTRHGAGPLPHECSQPPAPRFEDPTNLPNAYQGTLRFAPLAPQLLKDRIDRDRARASASEVAIEARLVLTCLDQVDEVGLASGRTWGVSEAPQALAEALGLEPGWESHGPSRATIKASQA